MLIEYMCRKTSVCTEHLPSHRVSHPQFPLCHKSDVITVRIHDDIFVRLLKTQHNIHELQLPRHYYGRIRQYAGGRVLLVENAMRVFWDVDWREEVVGVGLCIL